MIRNPMFALIIFFILSCSGTKKNPLETNEYKYHSDNSGNEHLVGKVDIDLLEKELFKSWDVKQNSYRPNYDMIDQIKKYINAYEIEIFFGTWCEDSKTGLPMFYRIIKETNYDLNRLSLYAVGSKGKLYKKTEQGFEKGKHITHVPTFIFYENGIEINRIVEDFVDLSLEADILRIVSGKNYKHKYQK